MDCIYRVGGRRLFAVRDDVRVKSQRWNVYGCMYPSHVTRLVIIVIGLGDRGGRGRGGVGVVVFRR